jgi:UDP-N-acetyl-D-glucosamine dehydrogenase
MRESPAMRLMQLFEQAGAEVRFTDPHVSRIPPMRDYAGFEGRTSVDQAQMAAGEFDAVVIATDHDLIDYAALLALECPVIDTRNAIARRGLPMDRVTKA